MAVSDCQKSPPPYDFPSTAWQKGNTQKTANGLALDFEDRSFVFSENLEIISLVANGNSCGN